MMVQENYIIESDVEESGQPVIQKKIKKATVGNNQLPDGYEIIEPEDPRQKATDDIINAAKSEGYYNAEYLGGEGASPQEVIDALINSDEPERVQELQEKSDEKKIESLKKVIATRDILFSRLNRTKDVELKVDGQLLVFKIKRLSESENNSLINKNTFGRAISEMSEEEFYESMNFRRKFLARTVVEPALTEEEWANNVDNSLVINLHEKVAEVIMDLDDSEGFR